MQTLSPHLPHHDGPSIIATFPCKIGHTTSESYQVLAFYGLPIGCSRQADKLRPPSANMYILQVNVEMILERQRKSVMEEVVEQLHAVVTEWQATMPPQLFPEVEWSKMRQLEFQESLRSRDALAVRLQGKSCVSCEHFKEHVRKTIDNSQACIDSIASTSKYTSNSNSFLRSRASNSPSLIRISSCYLTMNKG